LSIIFVDVVTFVPHEYAKLAHEMCNRSGVSEPVSAYTVGHATTKECYNEQFLSIKSGCYNEHRFYNERRGILSADVAHAHDMSGIPALIRASVIIFVIVF